MKKHTVVLRLFISLFFFSTVFLTQKTYANITDVEKSKISRQAAKLQIPFILNQGQTDEYVKFYAKTFGGTIFVTKNGEIVYALPDSEKAIAIKEEFIDGKLNEINGEQKSITKVSYFKGSDQSNWNSNISTFNIVNFGEIYEGIELKLKAHGNNVEKLFFVKPEKNPETIKINLKGAKGLKVNEKGELEAETELGTIKFTKPVAYQEEKVPSPDIFSPSPLMGEGRGGGKTGEGNRKYIDVAYIINGNEYGFKVGDYDRTKELVIDPLLASTFLGGTNHDGSWSYCNPLAIDQLGNVYVTGRSWPSLDFPTTPGAYNTNHDTHMVFVSKLNKDLTQLLASTFIGPAGYGESVAIDQSGNVYVTGYANSSDFPTTPGAYDITYDYDHLNNNFVSKLNSDLTQLLASTFISLEVPGYYGSSIAIDQSGNVYVTYGMGGYISKLNSDLTQLLASSTALADIIGIQYISSMIIDPSGNVYARGGGYTGEYISKLDNNLSAILASASIIGGSAMRDGGPSIAVDKSGNVYVTGMAGADFQTTPGAYDTTFNGGEGDVFVAKWTSDLTQVIAATFIGGSGSGFEGGTSIAIDQSGNVYVTGKTDSSDFPITSGSYSGNTDVFVSKLSSDLSQLFVSELLLGSSYNEQGVSIAIDSSNNVYVTGWTTSPDFPTTPGAYDVTHNGYYDVFISKFNFSSLPSIPSQSQGQGSGTNNQGTSNAPGLKTAPGLQKK